MIMFCKIFIFSTTTQCSSKRHKTKEMQFSHFRFEKSHRNGSKAQNVTYFGFLLQMYRWYGDVLSPVILCHLCPPAAQKLNVNMKLPIADCCIEFIRFQ